MTEEQAAGPVLRVVFYRTEAGKEPVRLWLKSLDRADRKTLGEDVKTAQYGWPLGMPLIRKLEPGLWEIRSHITGGIARVMFTVGDGTIGLVANGWQFFARRRANEEGTSRKRLRRLPARRTPPRSL